MGNTDSVVRFSYKDGQMQALSRPEVVVPDLPALGYHGHWTRNVVFNPLNGKMYVTVGSEADFGEAKPKRAMILEYNPDVIRLQSRTPRGCAIRSGWHFSPVRELCGRR